MSSIGDKMKKERPCEYADTTEEFYAALFPALKFVARKCGYNLLVHGSLKTDIDLVAVPWRIAAVSQEYVAERIRETAEAIIGTARVMPGDQKPTEKPNGRKAWSFHLVPMGCRGPYIDLSVFPPIRDD